VKGGAEHQHLGVGGGGRGGGQEGGQQKVTMCFEVEGVHCNAILCITFVFVEVGVGRHGVASLSLRSTSMGLTQMAAARRLTSGQ
jgi:hypothetical protein